MLIYTRQSTSVTDGETDRTTVTFTMLCTMTHGKKQMHHLLASFLFSGLNFHLLDLHRVRLSTFHVHCMIANAQLQYLLSQ